MQDGQLDPQHTQSAYATVMGGQRVSDTDPCTILFHHLNHPQNAEVLPQVLQAAHAIGPPAVRLLKLLVTSLYVGDSLFSERATALARGAFAVVQERQLHVLPGSPEAPVPVVEKVCSITRDVQAARFSEMSWSVSAQKICFVTGTPGGLNCRIVNSGHKLPKQRKRSVDRKHHPFLI
jgi:hypothetical protein